MGRYQRMHEQGLFGSVSSNYRRAYAERYREEWKGMDYRLAELLDSEPAAPTSEEQEAFDLEAMKEYQDKIFPPSHSCWHMEAEEFSDVLSDEYWQKGH